MTTFSEGFNPRSPLANGGSIIMPRPTTSRKQRPSFHDPLMYQMWNIMIVENFQAQCDNKTLPWPQAPAVGADIAATILRPDECIRETPLLSTLELVRRKTCNPTLTVEEFLELPVAK